MIKLILHALCFIFFSFQFNPDSIIGTWKIRSYDVIDKIKQSPAYLLGDEAARNAIDQQFQEVLDKGRYHFGSDTLVYSDIEGAKIVFRRAIWNIENDKLVILEIDRPFKRAAQIHKLKNDSLVISPIIDGVVGKSKLTFTREITK